MSLNQNTVEGKWLEIKGSIQKAWGKLTADEIEKTKGDEKAIRGLIQQKYGKVEEEAEIKLSKLFKNFKNEKEKAVSGVKKHLSDK